MTSPVSPTPKDTEAEEAGLLSPFGALDPALVARMEAAIDSQIMAVRGSRQNHYAAQACAAIAQAAVLAASPAVTEGERECPYPMCSCARMFPSAVPVEED